MGTNDIVVFDSMLRSNMQPKEKSTIRKWAESVIGPVTDVRVKDAPGGVLSAFRQGSEGLATAGLLAFVHVNTEEGLDFKGVPVDGVGGAALLGLSAFMGHSELASDARNIGNDALVVWSYRKMSDFFADRRMASGRALPAHLRPGTHQRSAEQDPIIREAKNL